MSLYIPELIRFSKLFMSVINEEFRRTPAKTFISDLFEGVLEYRTQCQTCGYTSPTTCELRVDMAHSSALPRARDQSTGQDVS